jgi:hypothetical protein
MVFCNPQKIGNKYNYDYFIKKETGSGIGTDLITVKS